jgi:hypothetical protein
MPVVRIDARRMTNWDTFHRVFADAFGFPDFYGRNMNAWIDCMTSLDEPEDGLTSIHGSANDPVILQIDYANSLSKELFEAITECSAFVNWRKLEVGEPAVLMLSCWRTQPT